MNSFANTLLDSRRAARCVGPNSEIAFGGEHVGDAAAERQLRADDREIDLFASGDLGDGVRIGGIDRNAPRHRG